MTQKPSDRPKGERIEISTEPITPDSKKTYIAGSVHPKIRVPFRSVPLSPTTEPFATNNGERQEVNETILLYDTSGPYTDPNVKIDPRRG